MWLLTFQVEGVGGQPNIYLTVPIKSTILFTNYHIVLNKRPLCVDRHLDGARGFRGVELYMGLLAILTFFHLFCVEYSVRRNWVMVMDDVLFQRLVKSW